MARVLIAGIGNIFRGDDGFGVEVVRRLADERLGEDIEVADFGIRGVHLAFEMASGKYKKVILVDAASRGESPGTLYAIEPEDADGEAAIADAHSLTPAAVVAWVRENEAEKLSKSFFKIPGKAFRKTCWTKFSFLFLRPRNVDRDSALRPFIALSIYTAAGSASRARKIRDLSLASVYPCPLTPDYDCGMKVGNRGKDTSRR